jgi:hypothetical protein
MTRSRSSAKPSHEAKRRTVSAPFDHGPGGRYRHRRRSVERTARGGARFVRRVGHGSTLLTLVNEVQRHVENDADVVRIIRWMVNTGAVVLTGTFAGRMV